MVKVVVPTLAVLSFGLTSILRTVLMMNQVLAKRQRIQDAICVANTANATTQAPVATGINPANPLTDSLLRVSLPSSGPSGLPCVGNGSLQGSEPSSTEAKNSPSSAVPVVSV